MENRRPGAARLGGRGRREEGVTGVLVVELSVLRLWQWIARTYASEDTVEHEIHTWTDKSSWRNRQQADESSVPTFCG